MTTEGFHRKLTAILSADVQGYSRLMGDDEEATVHTLNKYKEMIFRLIERHNGRLVDSPGDNLLAEFTSVVDAVRCGVQIQEDLKANNEELPPNRKMEFRIGINIGDVIQDGDKIYGDGVNVAARIESLADAGGICISRTAYDQVKKKLNIDYDYLGEYDVKNIDEPVRVYKLLMESGAEEVIQEEKIRTTASKKKMAYPLPDKPSIAILPFWNMSGDPTQEYIGDGISENINATLSKIGGIFVIASNSTFTYKGKPIKVQQVAEELAVQYVLEGSIQKAGDRLRVTAQLIDALTGHHLWSEKYDRKMEDIFDLQDEITKKIVVSLQAELVSGEDAYRYARDTENLEAWSKVAKGFNYWTKYTREDNERARKLFEDAVKLDPNYVIAWVYIGWCYHHELIMGWSESPSYSLNRANEAIQKASSIDDQHPWVYVLQGGIYIIQRKYDEALEKLNRSIALDPNSSTAHFMLGITMFLLGRFEESLKLIKKSMRVSPYYPWDRLAYLGRTYFFLNRYNEAITTFNQLGEGSRKSECPTYIVPSHLAMIYIELGREDEARAFMKEALENNPSVSLESLKMFYPFKNPAHLQRVLDAMRKAGMPE